MNNKFAIKLIILCCLCYNALADAVWQDTTKDHCWSTAANWTDGYVPTIASGWVIISAGSVNSPKAYPVLNAAVPDVNNLEIGYTGIGQAQLALTSGAALTIRDILNVGHYSTASSDVQGVLVMNGGTLRVGTAGVRKEMRVGVQETDGAVYLNNGTITVSKLLIPYSNNSIGRGYINGGTLFVAEDGLTIQHNLDNGRDGKIDLAGGQLVLDGDRRETVRLLFQCELISAYAGNSDIATDFNVTYPGKTTVTAKNYNPLLAHKPNPDNEKKEIPLETVLSWMPGEGAVSYDIYLGNNYEDVNNGYRLKGDFDGNGKVDMQDLYALTIKWLQCDNIGLIDSDGSGKVNLGDFTLLASNWQQQTSAIFCVNQTNTNFMPNTLDYGKNYYWRVDVVTQNEIRKGCIWSFTTKQYVDDYKPGWVLTFSDEFNGNELDYRVWDVKSESPTDYICSRWPENVKVENGWLKLLTKKENRGGKEWTAAHIWSRVFKQKYGYWESSFRIGDASGLNNAFWMIRDGDFEIDIDEGRYPDTMNMTLHSALEGGGHWQSGQSYDTNLPLSHEFHTRAVEWTPTELIWYFDGHEVRRLNHTQTPAEPNKEVAVRFSTAVHPWAGLVTEALDNTTMDVNYVRIYTLDNNAFEPSPADGQIEISCYTNLKWSAGAEASEVNGHRIYLGTDYDRTLNADMNSNEYMGTVSEPLYQPVTLHENKIYYWRIDEVNDQVVWKGDVWSFTTLPQPETITPEYLVAITSGISVWGDRKPVYVVNGAGLTGQAHSNVADKYMWLADSSTGWFKIGMNGYYDLGDYQMKIWNFNMGNYTTRGVKQVDIYYSDHFEEPEPPDINPDAWTLLGQAGQRLLTQASGRMDYGTNTSFAMPDVITFPRGSIARWIFFDINSSYGTGYIGLSEIQFNFLY
jgi:beta-glucanase (GH16 family)